MKLLITGAGGFLGRFVVASAISRGHHVRAMIRPASRQADISWEDHRQVEIVRGDLRARGSFDAMLEGVDAVIHLAASKSGDIYEQFGGSVIATENLLAAMVRTGVAHMVLVSSFSVYEYLGRWEWSQLDETSPLATHPGDRDEYCQTKLEQERIVREHFQTNQGRCVILRPGVIYGKDNLWTARLGIQVNSRWWIRTGTFAPLPLTYVENCADAVTMAAEYGGKDSELVLNIVDSETPSQRVYLNALRRRLDTKPWIIPIPWTAMRVVARLAWLTNRFFFGGGAKIPGVLVPSRLHARCKPLRYSNQRLVKTLGWTPGFSFEEAIERSLRKEPHLPDPQMTSVDNLASLAGSRLRQ
jgi:nucleoside-diphosphate-sugar epimerase